MLRGKLETKITEKLSEKLKSRKKAQYEEFSKLNSQHNARKKYLEQTIKDEKVKRKFIELLNMREIILMELKRCQEAEKDIFLFLSN